MLKFEVGKLQLIHTCIRAKKLHRTDRGPFAASRGTKSRTAETVRSAISTAVLVLLVSSSSERSFEVLEGAITRKTGLR